MYNRYIPQPDGSYRRSRIPDPCRPHPHKPNPQPAAPPPPPPPPPQPHKPACSRPEPRHDSAYNFLRRLLPKDFDTGDLLIIILLLLMAGDCPDDQNTALLTLIIYFFM